jgi:predicted metal-binding protein
MVDPAMASAGVTVFICVSCNRPDLGATPEGRLLFDAVAARAGGAVAVRPVECLAVCKRPCTVALQGEGKWAYVVGDLDHDRGVDDVIAAVSYAASENGIIPWRQRPQSFRKGVVSRVPPLDCRPENPSA